MANSSEDAVRALVMDHVEAFNAHDRPRLLAGLAPDVVWSTGADTFYGLEVLESLRRRSVGDAAVADGRGPASGR